MANCGVRCCGRRKGACWLLWTSVIQSVLVSSILVRSLSLLLSAFPFLSSFYPNYSPFLSLVLSFYVSSRIFFLTLFLLFFCCSSFCPRLPMAWTSFCLRVFSFSDSCSPLSFLSSAFSLPTPSFFPNSCFLEFPNYCFLSCPLLFFSFLYLILVLWFCLSRKIARSSKEKRSEQDQEEQQRGTWGFRLGFGGRWILWFLLGFALRGGWKGEWKRHICSNRRPLHINIGAYPPGTYK